MTEQEYIRIRDFVKKHYGIDLSNKQKIIEGRLDNYLRFEGWTSYTAYMNDVEKDITGELEKKLVDHLTTNHTYFMREVEHFDFLKNKVLPELKKKEEVSKDIRIWCAAASSGEEPYTIAMILSDFFGLEFGKWDTTVLATDVSTEVLLQAIKGIYTDEQIAPVPDNWKRRFFKQIPGTNEFEVKEELKKEVLFRKFNLMSNFPFKKKMNVVFLRNVMIYFDEPTKNKILKKIYDCLEPGGYLFLGKTETLNRNVVPFKLVSPSIFIK